MANSNSQKGTAVLRIPKHLANLLDPEDLLSFIETKTFQRNWKDCGLSDDDLCELQLGIMMHPKGHPVIGGTGGLRKIRFSPADTTRGKSGAYRACYVYFEEFGIVLLVTAYPKNRKDNLSKATKNAIRTMIEEQHKLLNREPIK